MSGATVWITGLPAAGKTTLGDALATALAADRDDGRAPVRLDGDALRSGLNADLGFSPADRHEAARRAAHAAHAIAASGAIAVVSLITPYAADRATARDLHAAGGLRFLEVFVDTPVEVCARRDVKHLYARARAGEITGLTGVDAPYERPERPDLTVRPEDADPVAALLAALARDRGA